MGGLEPVIIEGLAEDTHLFDLQIDMTNFTCGLCPMSFETWVEKTKHELQMHPITSWYEEVDQVPPSSAEHLMTELLNVETDNLEFSFNMDL